MPKLRASRVSFFLDNGGFRSIKDIGTVEIEDLRRLREEPAKRILENTRQSGYRAQDNADGTVIVAFHGLPDREIDMLRSYRRVLENCSYQVEEEADPSREGRKILRVVSG